MEVSNEMIFGVVTVAVIPITIWGYKMFSMVKKLIEMHEDPEKYEFGTIETNKLIDANNKELRSAAEEQTRQLKDLVHYTRAMCTLANNGKPILPREPEIK